MSKKAPLRPRLLVTNDDGIDSRGLHALARRLASLGEVTVVAPERNWSVSGHQKALNRYLRADPVTMAAMPNITAYRASSAPADCVAIALLGLLESPPDLVVSGINRGPNLGQDITYSGTVAAAFEAAIFGLPAIAISLNSHDDEADFAPAAEVAARVAERVLAEGLPPHSLLNVNVPELPAAELGGTRVVRLGRREYADRLESGLDPAGRPYYWIVGAVPGGDTQTPDTDIWAIHHGYVAVTPIQLDMTNEALLESVAGWNLDDAASRPG